MNAVSATQVLEIAKAKLVAGEEAYMFLGDLWLKCSEATARSVWHGLADAFGSVTRLRISSDKARSYTITF